MKHKSKMIFVIAGMFVILAIALYNCGGGGGGGSYGGGGATPPMATSTVQVVACPASGTTDVSIVSMTAPGFSPSNPPAVPVNTTVKWTNIDSILHTVTSTTVPANGTFDVQVNPGASVCLKFTAAGTFNYHCSIHPTTMIGLVTVQ